MALSGDNDSTSENAVSCSVAPSIEKNQEEAPLKPGRSVVQFSNNVIAKAWSRRGPTKSLVSLAPTGVAESDSHRLRLMVM